jgi:sugar-specific transcriptional regulator TrmB
LHEIRKVSETEEKQTLVDLGLTVVQARIYLALTRAGSGTITGISKAAQLDRSEVYRGVSELLRMGLVEQTVSKPCVFEGLPRNEGLGVLLKRKSLEFADLEKRTGELIQSPLQGPLKFVESGCRGFVVLERDAALRRWMKATEGAQESIDFIIRWRGFVDGLLERRAHWERLLKRGVRVRGVVSEPERQANVLRVVGDLGSRGFYQIRWVFSPPEAVFSLIDGKELLLTVLPEHVPSHGSVLWSNNASLARVTQDYFEARWRVSSEIRNKRRGFADSLSVISL